MKNSSSLTEKDIGFGAIISGVLGFALAVRSGLESIALSSSEAWCFMCACVSENAFTMVCEQSFRDPSLRGNQAADDIVTSEGSGRGSRRHVAPAHIDACPPPTACMPSAHTRVLHGGGAARSPGTSHRNDGHGTHGVVVLKGSHNIGR